MDRYVVARFRYNLAFDFLLVYCCSSGVVVGFFADLFAGFVFYVKAG